MASGDLSYLKLSGSTDGKGIKVTGTSTAATVTVHAAHATSNDEIDVYAYNDDAAAKLLTLEWGGATDPDNVIRMTIPSRVGPVFVCSLPLSNSLVVKAFAETANVIMIYGRVKRID